MNLKSHHRREAVVRRFRRDTLRLNSPGQVYDYPTPEEAVGRILIAVMRTRKGLCAMAATRMAAALWECDD